MLCTAPRRAAPRREARLPTVTEWNSYRTGGNCTSSCRTTNASNSATGQFRGQRVGGVEFELTQSDIRAHLRHLRETKEEFL
jgi:hypothetical protein